MPIDNRIKRDPTTDSINDPLTAKNPIREINNQASDFLGDPSIGQRGVRERQLIRWRVPLYGFVDMYINPQSLSISESKSIQPQRTKGGYVIQYWGENLTTIKLSGHTGSAGIEGINILYKVYRAEQDAFQSVSQVLIDRLGASSSNNVFGAIGQSLLGGGGLGKHFTNVASTLFGASTNPPLLPTLASLATAVELFYQGWFFKGYFTDFSITESVSNGVGIFNYDLSFTVLDKRGIRTNYIPWHRSPAEFDSNGNPISNSYRKSNANIVPLNFKGED